TTASPTSTSATSSSTSSARPLRSSSSPVARPSLNRRANARTRSRASVGLPPEPPIAYRVAMPDPGSHEFHVEMHVPALPERATADIVSPAWAPASYLVRDFVRHVYDLTITDDRGYPL